jgi:hypothetical protein
MKQSAARGKTPLERFRLYGRGYIQFALEYPEHFQVMFDLPSSLDQNPDYVRAGDVAFETLLGFIAECQNTNALSPGDSKPLAFMAWSMVHGIAKLASSSHLPFSTAGVLRFADTASRVLAKGMSKGVQQAV